MLGLRSADISMEHTTKLGKLKGSALVEKGRY